MFFQFLKWTVFFIWQGIHGPPLPMNGTSPIAVISKAMGHTSERTTRIYIAELNSEIVHTANKEITDWRTGLPL